MGRFHSRWHLPLISQTGAWALEIKIRNSPGLPLGRDKYSSAISCFLSPRLQSIIGIPRALAKARKRRLKRPAIRMRCALSRYLSEPYLLPPSAEATARVAHAKVRVQHNAVHTIVRSFEKVSVVFAQW